jgi:hypothetical protein
MLRHVSTYIYSCSLIRCTCWKKFLISLSAFEKFHRFQSWQADSSDNAGHAVAQAVIRRLPISEAGVRAQVMSCGVCDRQSGTGVGFLLVLHFALPILIQATAPHSSSIIRGGNIGHLVADVPIGVSLTPHQVTKKTKLSNNAHDIFRRCLVQGHRISWIVFLFVISSTSS